MDSNEQFVREYWADMRPMVLSRFDICDMEGEMNWPAAREFTEQRLEEIRQVEEEIRWLQWPSVEFNALNKARLRILAREQTALADLKRGMKERHDCI